MFFFYNSISLKKTILYIITLISFFLAFSLPALAVDYMEEAQNRKFLEVQSNNYENWPLGPSIGAQAAILMDANTGSILYAKNIHEKLYPASITKLLTSYIAMQNGDLKDEVSFSEEAVLSINWWEDANMGVSPYTVLSLEDVLSGILVGSANEAAYALAEHISGDVPSFARLMNQTAKELGCQNSNFVNPNGIHDDNHYTTAYDMALIARAFFSNETLSRLSGTLRYEVPVNNTQKKEGIVLTAKSQLLYGKPYAYDSLIGTKTGYTNMARQTLVSCAEKNGVKLICVILKEEAPYQFADTVELFDYGFDNFDALYLNEIQSPYSIENHFFTTATDIFGDSSGILSLDSKDYILLPNTITFDDLTSKVSYDGNTDNSVCSINYYYKDYFLGCVDVELAVEESYIFDFSNQKYKNTQKEHNTNEKTIFINVIHILLMFVCFTILMGLILFLRSLLSKKRTAKNRNRRLRNRISFGNHWDIKKF